MNNSTHNTIVAPNAISHTRLGTAQNHRDGDAGDVADAHAGCGRNAEGLKGRNVAVLGLGGSAFGDEAEHFAEAAHLHEARGEREPDAEAHEHDDENVGPEDVVDAPHKIS